MAEELKNNNNEEVMSSNFIHTFIDEDIAEGGQYEGKTVHTRFPPNQTATYTLVMQRLFALTLAQQKSTTDFVTLEWTTQTLLKKM